MEEKQLPKNHSEQLNELFASLAKAQAEFKPAGTVADNPYFKSSYADLAELVRVSRPILGKYGLSVIQNIVADDHGHNALQSWLCHASGQWIQGSICITPQKQDVQSLGSYITYLRRYAYAALLGIVVCDEDDDGNAAVYEKPLQKNNGNIVPEQVEELEYELKNHPDIKEKLLSYLQINDLSQMPKAKYQMCLNKLREIKLNKKS